MQSQIPKKLECEVSLSVVAMGDCCHPDLAVVRPLPLSSVSSALQRPAGLFSSLISEHQTSCGLKEAVSVSV